MVLFNSCTDEKMTVPFQTEMSEENIRLRYFKNTRDSLLSKEMPVDFLFYKEHWQGPITLDTLQNKLPAQKELIGSFNYWPLPAGGELYKCNLTGDNEDEYLLTFERSPLCGGGSFLLVFADDKNKNRFISSNFIDAEMITQIQFSEMDISSGLVDVVVFFDLQKSVYYNKGISQLRLINATDLEFVFMTRMVEIDWMKYEVDTTSLAMQADICRHYFTRTSTMMA